MKFWQRLLSILVALSFAACQTIPLPQNSKAKTTQTSARQTYGPPRVIARLKSREIRESSGLVASHTPGIYWTHNDSGDGPYIYAVDEQGQGRGVFRVLEAKARDWEDIAAGPGPDPRRRYLYIGDIGDNNHRRAEVVVYRIPEPTIEASAAASSRRKPLLTEPSEAIKLRYPDGAHDAEALLLHPVTGDLYLVTKAVFANPSVYKAGAPIISGEPINLIKQAELKVPGLLGGIITGGGIAPNGRRVALCDYMQGYELVLPAASNKFDDIWRQPMKAIDLGRRSQGEAVTYRLDGRALMALSEGKGSPLIQVLRR
jgi:hypothetical protein